MKVYQTDEIKNVALLGNAGSGKTTLSEAMLFQGGVISRRGDIASKNTVSDFREIEQTQGGTVFSTVMYAEWAGKKINFIDCPGLEDFCNGVISSLYVADAALLVLNAQHSVEVGSELHWRHAKRMNKPVIFVVNQVDHEKANFDKTIEDAKNMFGKKVVIVQYPVATGSGFNAIIDILKMKMLKFSGDGSKYEEVEIPANEKDRADELQSVLMEAAAEADDALMEAFFENAALTEEQLVKGIKDGLKNRVLFPLFCVSSKKDIGVNRLMDFITAEVPSPNEMPVIPTVEDVEVKCQSNGLVSLFVFKNTVEPHLGEVLNFKVMSGTLEEGADLINQKKQSKERFSQIFVAAGKNRVKVTKLCAGDIGATVKLKETKTNHTLNAKGADWTFKKMEFPNPKYRTAIKAANEAEDEKLSEVLARMRDEDPTLILEYSKELKQLILHGQGEYHINTLKWHLDHVFKIQANFFAPRIPYRETITKSAVSSYRHKKQSGGAGQFGEVHIFIEPFEEGKPAPTKFKNGDKEANLSVRDTQIIDLDWGGKLVFYNCIVGGVIDARFMPAILKGIMEKMETGPLTGSYARDIRVAVFDGKMHPVDSNEISFKLAGLNAFKEGFKTAGPKIMEPIYDVEIIVPSERMGDVMSDLQTRRAIIMGMSSEAGYEKLMARIPLAEMNRYSTVLSSLTNGRATYNMKFAEYVQVPSELQDQLLKAYEAQEEDE